MRVCHVAADLSPAIGTSSKNPAVLFKGLGICPFHNLLRWSLLRVNSTPSWISIKSMCTGDHTTSHHVASVIFHSQVCSGPEWVDIFIYLFLNVFTVIAKTEDLNEDMKFIGQMVNVSFTASLGDDEILVKNPSKGTKSTQDYLSLLDKKTLSKLISIYKPDFEMFQYSPEGYY